MTLDIPIIKNKIPNIAHVSASFFGPKIALEVQYQNRDNRSDKYKIKNNFIVKII